jgi:electron transfer flavoprotein alpha subunit
MKRKCWVEEQMMKALVIAEHDNKSLKPATASLVTAARQLGAEVTILVAGQACAAVAASAAGIAGVTKVLLAEHASQEHQLAESLSALIVKTAAGFDAVVAAASTTGKNVLPRVAALLDVAQISEVLAIVDKDTFVRPVYAGNALATVRSADAVKVLTVRTSAFDAAATAAAAAPVEILDAAVPQQLSSFVSASMSSSSRPELGAARVVVSGGRGLGSAENFAILDKLADKLGAAIGASRAAVDAGYVGNDLQVGQTGKVVAPELYIAIGISGAIQHLAGMKDSKVIVAINKDAEAPIFQVADYGLVTDLFTAVPELESLL